MTFDIFQVLTRRRRRTADRRMDTKRRKHIRKLSLSSSEPSLAVKMSEADVDSIENDGRRWDTDDDDDGDSLSDSDSLSSSSNAASRVGTLVGGPASRRVTRLLDDVLSDETAGRIRSACSRPTPDRPVDPRAVDSLDYECALCFRLLFQPVTTPCGHTYCRMCLDRTLDHSTDCPMCKASLRQFLAERGTTGSAATDEFVSRSIERLLPAEHAERTRQHDREMQELAGMVGGGGGGSAAENAASAAANAADTASGVDGSGGNPSGVREIPVFVCTMSFPNIPCPLHVFEPRYRLMIRRCMESGTREFGMCCAVDESEP